MMFDYLLFVFERFGTGFRKCYVPPQIEGNHAFFLEIISL